MLEPKRNDQEAPGDARAAGEVTFNHSSHDGRFLLGAEPWLFETRWSTAGQGRAHLYNDPKSIRGIAIAEDVSTIVEVNAGVIARSDFTSRSRTPHTGQCAILENQNGFFAVVQIISVGHSDRPSDNIMRLRYAIQTDGSSDFSLLDGATSAISETSAIRAVLDAANDATTALAAVQGAEANEDEIPFGHNGPPTEYALSEAERHQVIAAVEVVTAQVIQSTPDRRVLGAALETIARAAKTVGVWIASKLDLAVDEFAKSIGKATAVVAGGFATWVVVHGKLSVLADLLSAFTW